MSCIACGGGLVQPAVGRKQTHFCSPRCRSLHRKVKSQESVDFKLKQILGGAKHRAKRDSLNFDLTLEYLQGLYHGQKGCCIVSGREFDWSKHPQYRNNPNAPTLDKIIPTNGYTIGNVRLLTYHANIALNQFGLGTFLELCQDTLRTQDTL